MGFSLLGQGQGTGTSTVTWEPTVVYLLLLILGEMVVFGFISRMLR